MTCHPYIRIIVLCAVIMLHSPWGTAHQDPCHRLHACRSDQGT
jgi:hypothetical protein